MHIHMQWWDEQEILRSTLFVEEIFFFFKWELSQVNASFWVNTFQWFRMRNESKIWQHRRCGVVYVSFSLTQFNQLIAKILPLSPSREDMQRFAFRVGYLIWRNIFSQKCLLQINFHRASIMFLVVIKQTNNSFTLFKFKINKLQRLHQQWICFFVKHFNCVWSIAEHRLIRCSNKLHRTNRHCNWMACNNLVTVSFRFHSE